MSFDLSLAGSESVTLLRGPYLQVGTSRSAVIRWRTDVPTQGWVRYGAAPNALNLVSAAGDDEVEHEVTLRDLKPATKYYYSIGTPDGALAGEDEDHVFVTPPVPGTRAPVRVWVIGDSGRANADAAAVRDAYKTFTASRHTDVWLMLGDNAYNEGTDDQYQKAVFELYPALLRRAFLWPTLGNHEYYGSPGKPDEMAYLSIFTLPTKGEAGGAPSGTEYYYAFDVANIHFVVLDSMVSSRKPGGAMLSWLEADLRQNRQNWLVVYFHHPPYSKGSHDSDWETELVEMREHALPVLERFGVDLVLAGHSHTYERSMLLDGHYGTSDTLTAAMKKNPGSGRRDQGGPYTKSGAGPVPREGAVYAVAGSSGGVTAGALDHPAMLVSLAKLGSMVLDVNGLEMDAIFLRENGQIDDRFAISKGTAKPASRPDGGIGPRTSGDRMDAAGADGGRADGPSAAPVTPDPPVAPNARSGCQAVPGRAGDGRLSRAWVLGLAGLLVLHEARRRTRVRDRAQVLRRAKP